MPALHQPVLHAFGRLLHGFADVDLAEIELHAAGIDGREIENVVDECRAAYSVETVM